MHLTCALWVPDVSLSQPEAMAGVQLDGLSPDRADLTCYVCKQARRCCPPCILLPACSPLVAPISKHTFHHERPQPSAAGSCAKAALRAGQLQGADLLCRRWTKTGTAVETRNAKCSI